GPEAVDDVHRGHVELDLLAQRQLELRGLHAAELREPVGEGPLVPDDLHLEAVGRRGGPDRRRALPRARPGRPDPLDPAQGRPAPAGRISWTVPKTNRPSTITAVAVIQVAWTLVLPCRGTPSSSSPSPGRRRQTIRA